MAILRPPSYFFLTKASLVLGVILVVSSSLVLDVLTRYYCPSFCPGWKDMLASQSLAICAGSVQIIFTGFILFQGVMRTRLWQMVHVLICLLSVTAFSLAVYRNQDYSYNKGVLWKAGFCIHWCSSLILLILSFFSNNDSNRNASSSTPTA